jgi:hypothetical protein
MNVPTNKNTGEALQKYTEEIETNQISELVFSGLHVCYNRPR